MSGFVSVGAASPQALGAALRPCCAMLPPDVPCAAKLITRTRLHASEQARRSGAARQCWCRPAATWRWCTAASSGRCAPLCGFPGLPVRPGVGAAAEFCSSCASPSYRACCHAQLCEVWLNRGVAPFPLPLSTDMGHWRGAGGPRRALPAGRVSAAAAGLPAGPAAGVRPQPAAERLPAAAAPAGPLPAARGGALRQLRLPGARAAGQRC